MDGVQPKVFPYAVVATNGQGPDTGKLALLRCDPYGNLFVNTTITSSADNQDGNPTLGSNVPTQIARLEAFNASTGNFDRLRIDANGNLLVDTSGGVVSPDNADGNAALGTSVPTVIGRLEGWNPSTGKWDRLKVDTADNLFVNVANNTTPALTLTVPGSANITVTNASQQFAAANTSRQYIIIQNNDTTGIVYVGFGGAVTAANGLKIAPGGNYEPLKVSGQTINMIGSIASNANVIMLLG